MVVFALPAFMAYSKVFFVGDQCAIPSTDITDVWGMREVKVALLAIAASEADLKAFLAKPRISVASAERAMTKWTEARITGVCMCTGKCNTKSCSCFKHGLCCSSKCHKGAFVVFSSCVVFSRVCVASDLVAPAVLRYSAGSTSSSRNTMPLCFCSNQ